MDRQTLRDWFDRFNAEAPTASWTASYAQIKVTEK
jgi:hypothetical protein